MKKLINRVALITGASSGIGYVTAKLFAAHGAKVVVTARRDTRLALLVKEIENAGGKAVPFVGDIQEEQVAKAAVELAVGHFGGLDIAFNNAGSLGAMGAIENVTLAGWQDTIAINLTSAFLCAKYQIPELKKSKTGSLIFTSTFVGTTAGMPGMAAYAASKAGLVGLTKALATELGAMGVRVNAVLPGGVDTDMGKIVADSPEKLAFVEGLHALKRVAQPEEIARSALYLASDDSSFTTGTALLVDGGVSIQRV